ncbi:MAG: thioredoxin family protein, partial [Pseudomonadota bacterium]
AGVLAAFVSLAGILLALKAGGAALGWGYQLQTPAVVAGLAMLMFLVGLSLSGVFELGASLMGLGAQSAGRGGVGGAFFTGLLAVAVAAPCTAPFMAAALGYAFTQSAPTALLVFAALGLGLAAPYLALSFTPALRAVLPKPGAWMERVKQALAFPMYGAAVWLVWVLSRQAGPDAAGLLLAAMVLVAFGVWAMGAARGGSAVWRGAGGMTATLAAVAAVLFIARIEPAGPSVAAAATTTAGGEDLSGQAFDAQAVETLRAEGRPVFIDFTAAWCITCQSNKLTALNRPAVRAAFEARGVVFMTADWTTYDAAITRALEGYGRSGVPLYVYYAPGAAEPEILPQILTEGLVLRALEEGDPRTASAT